MNEKSGLFGRKHATLWRISLWANVLAPVALFIYILLAIGQISQYNQIAHTQFNSDLLELFSHNFGYVLDVIFQMGREVLSGAIYYVLLKGIALAFDILIETDINYREKPQGSSSQENEIDEKKEIANERDSLEEWEEKLLDDNNQPELYDTLEVLELRDKIDKVATGAIVVWILLGLLNFQITRMLLQGVLISSSELIQSIQPMVITTLATVIQIVVIYFPLKALSQILRVLVEMEFNSRKAI